VTPRELVTPARPPFLKTRRVPEAQPPRAPLTGPAMSASPKSAGSGATSGHGHHGTASQRAILAALRAWQTGMAPRAALLVLAVSFLLAVTIVASTAGDGGGDNRMMNAMDSASSSPGFVGGAAPMMMADGDMAMGAPAMAPQPMMAPARAGGSHAKRYRANGARAAPAPPSDAMFGSGGGGGGSPEFAAANAESVRTTVSEMTSLREQKQAAGDDGALQGLVLIKDGSVSGEVPDVKSAVARLEAFVASPAVGGHVESSNQWTDQWLAQRLAEAAARAEARRTGVHPPPGTQVKPLPGPTGATVNLRVPVDKFESALGGLREMLAELGGSVTSESSSARDVTSEYVDVVARQRADELAAAQLEKLMAAAATVGDVLAVKRELDHVTQRLEGAKAQRKSLEARATYSSLHVILTLPQPPQEPPPSPTPRPGWSPLRTAGHAVGTLARGGQLAVDVAVYTAVLAVPVAAAAALAVWLARSAAPLARPAWARLLAAATAKVLPTSSSAAAGGGASATSPGGSGTGAYHAIPASAVD
jgi:hypothetical protein